KRSVEFYQGLFGMPVAARQGPTTILRIGAGPQFLAVGAAAPNTTPAINDFCLTVEDFNVDRIIRALAEHGVTESETNGPMKVRVRMGGPENGGAKEGTPELYLGDPDGIVCQLQDVAYCGGAGVKGNVCGAPEPAPKPGLLAVKDLSHFTIFSTDGQRTNKFYQDVFCLSIRSYQGPAAPTLAVGPTVQFLMFAGGGAPARAGAPPTERGRATPGESPHGRRSAAPRGRGGAGGGGGGGGAGRCGAGESPGGRPPARAGVFSPPPRRPPFSGGGGKVGGAGVFF